jgi:CxxC motif-containing protein (DUF1111 family)
MQLFNRMIPMVALGAILLFQDSLHAQSKDPGPRPLRANPNAPPMLPGAAASDASLFPVALQTFMRGVSVNGTFVSPTGLAFTGVGLGPRFNHFDCSSCHRVPFAGGASFSVTSQALLNSAVGTDYGNQAPNQVAPPFLKNQGPTLAARLKYNVDGTRDGSVHQIWTIAGRPDAPGCAIQQTDWNAELAKNNVAIRITTPTLGAGLVEAILDSVIVANKNAGADAKTALGIHGHENRNTSDGSISKFGWKAQTRGLREFSADAFRNEMGVTNDIFISENDATANCNFHAGLEDAPVPTPNGSMLRTDLVTHFMRFLAPPTPLAPTASSTNGQALFNSIGCAQCHTTSFTTGPNSTPAVFAGKQVPLYSDLLVHHMGAGLADDIIQGQAGPDEFRTAPLWGLGQRFYLLHDGRTTDLKAAIAAHSSPTSANFPASEANAVVTKWNGLTEVQKQDILNFLRGL